MNADTTLVENLRQEGCQVIEPTSPEDLPEFWNGALRPKPSLIVICSSEAHVTKAFRIVTQSGNSVAVYSRGQDWNGRSLRDGAVILDISSLNSIEVDAERHQAVVEGGVSSRKLNDALVEQGLIAVLGNEGNVGMAGLVMGGGYGPLMSLFGLACDNLLSAKLLLADGTTVLCDSKQNQDLLWALQGGGGNFGVVLSMTIRLHPARSVKAGTWIFSTNDARQVLAEYLRRMESAPDELFGSLVFSTGPTGKDVIVLSLLWFGDQEVGDDNLQWNDENGVPIRAEVRKLRASDILSETDGKLVKGRQYEVATRWLSTLDEPANQVLVSAFEQRTSSLSAIVIHHCHGAPTRFSSDKTAFSMREPHFTALIYGAWDDESGGMTEHQQWARNTAAELEPYALPGGYANLLADDARSRVDRAFGSNGERLRHLKNIVDPAGIFSAIPLPDIHADK